MVENENKRSTAAFKRGEYSEIIRSLSEQGYEAVSLDVIDRQKRHMFLRHDVDLCPERALEMAREESSLHVSATYYFLVSTRLYSIAAQSTRRILHELIDLGHEIGLHFDASQYEGTQGSLDDYAVIECELLEACSGRPVKSISFHRPAHEFLNRKEAIAGRRHCYEPVFFSEIGYISDSNGGWHHGHPLNHPSVEAGTAIQLLTHPIWWTNMSPLPAVVAMRKFHAERKAQLQDDLCGTVTAYRQYLDSAENVKG